MSGRRSRSFEGGSRSRTASEQRQEDRPPLQQRAKQAKQALAQAEALIVEADERLNRQQEERVAARRQQQKDVEIANLQQQVEALRRLHPGLQIGQPQTQPTAVGQEQEDRPPLQQGLDKQGIATVRKTRLIHE
jgi:hypothetical protein